MTRNNVQAVEEIKAQIKSWAAALAEKDLETMHKDYAEDYRIFDVGSNQEGVDAVKALWQKCLPYFDRPEIEYKDMKIEACADMAFVHFYSRIRGMKHELPPEMANAWVRGTVCFRKIDGNWTVLHEHISFPVDCEKCSIIFDDHSIQKAAQ